MSCPPLPLTELSAAVRQRGELVARFAPGAAEAFACCAEWLEASLAAHLGEAITLQEAARESGWSYEGLRRRLHEDPSLNVGGPKAPLILRSDLPRLGAPRGPRGPYGPRAARPRQESAAPSEMPADEQQEQPVRTTPAEGSALVEVALDDGTEDAERGSTPVEEAAAGEVDDQDVEPEANALRPVVQAPETRRATAVRKRPVPPRTRRRSSKERFTELLALAAQS